MKPSVLSKINAALKEAGRDERLRKERDRYYVTGIDDVNSSYFATVLKASNPALFRVAQHVESVLLRDKGEQVELKVLPYTAGEDEDTEVEPEVNEPFPEEQDALEQAAPRGRRRRAPDAPAEEQE